MTTTVITIKQAGNYFGKVLPAVQRKAAMRGLLSAAARGVQTIQTTIIPSRTPSPVDRGIYRAGWRSGPTDDGAELWNDDPTAPLVEGGVRASNIKPGRAMVSALVAWVQRKGMASDVKEATGVAWAIIQRMKEKGIFNRGSTGLGILKEFDEKHAEAYSKEEIEHELRKVI